MSRVSNIIITTGLGEDVSYLKSKFKEFKVNGLPYYLTSADDEELPKAWYGGSKLLEANLFIRSYNYLDLEKLIEFMRKEVEWDSPYTVQLIIKEQNDMKFRVIDLFSE